MIGIQSSDVTQKGRSVMTQYSSVAAALKERDELMIPVNAAEMKGLMN